MKPKAELFSYELCSLKIHFRILRIFLNENLSGFYLIPHQHTENLIRKHCIINRHQFQNSMLHRHCRISQLVEVHFPQTLIPLYVLNPCSADFLIQRLKLHIVIHIIMLPFCSLNSGGCATYTLPPSMSCGI